MKLNQLTIAEARVKLDSGEITAVALTESCLNRIKEVDGRLHACLLIDKTGAMAQAAEADRRLQSGQTGGLLGIPFLAKDNILTKGLATTAASKILEDYIAPYDATVIAKLKAAGAILLGKTNLDEFAHGASTEYSAFGPTKNPWDLKRTPGGSSGGSAAAVAADLCLFALGTDTGGSVRHPAAFCGVIGYKPSYGLCSRFGLIAMTSSTDVPGCLAKTALDVSLVLSVLSGPDEHDSTTVASKAKNYSQKVGAAQDLSKITIGLPAEYLTEGVSSDIKKKIEEAAAALEKLGAKIKPVSLPHSQYGVSVYYIITPSEVSSNLARFDGVRYGFSKERVKDLQSYYEKTRGQGFGPEAKRRIMLGTYALSSGYYDAYYLQAQKVRTKIIEDFNAAFAQVDLIITPTVPGLPFKLGEQDNDPLKMYLEDIFLTPASLAGLPAVSVPAGLVDGLPVGLQIIGPRMADEQVLTAAAAYGKVSKQLRPQL